MKTWGVGGFFICHAPLWACPRVTSWLEPEQTSGLSVCAESLELTERAVTRAVPLTPTPPPPPPLLSLPQNMSDYNQKQTHTFSFKLRVLAARCLMAPRRLRTKYPCEGGPVEGLQKSCRCCESCWKMTETHRLKGCLLALTCAGRGLY